MIFYKVYSISINVCNIIFGLIFTLLVNASLNPFSKIRVYFLKDLSGSRVSDRIA